MRDLARHVPISCSDPSVSKTATLSYSLDDPFVIRAMFENPGGEIVPWCVGRDMIAAALAGAVPQTRGADVSCTRLAGTFRMLLRSTDRRATVVVFSLEDMATFYAATLAMCRPGDEMNGYDMDAGLERLLGGEQQ